MFGVYILTPCVSTLCVATFSRVLTSLSLGRAGDYGLHIVTTRPKSKRRMKLHPKQALVASPWPASSTRCHSKHGLAVVESTGRGGRGLSPRSPVPWTSRRTPRPHRRPSSDPRGKNGG